MMEACFMLPSDYFRTFLGHVLADMLHILLSFHLQKNCDLSQISFWFVKGKIELSILYIFSAPLYKSPDEVYIAVYQLLLCSFK